MTMLEPIQIDPGFKVLLQESFSEVAPLYVAQPAIEKWIREHGFVIFNMGIGQGCRVQECSEGRQGIAWGSRWDTYQDCIIAILDEIMRRSKDNLP